MQHLIKYNYSNVFIDIIHRLNYLGDLELEADLIHDYTAALQLDDPGWFSHNHIEDTDWQEQGTLVHKGTFLKIKELMVHLYIMRHDLQKSC